MSFEFLRDLIGRIEVEAPDSLLSPLMQALQDSLNVKQCERPPSALMILEAHEVSIDALIYFDVVLNKNEAARFLISIGYDQSEVAIKRKLLRRGRYFERYGRQLLTFKNTNIYTYAELIDIIGRPMIRERFEKIVEELHL